MNQTNRELKDATWDQFISNVEVSIGPVFHVAKWAVFSGYDVEIKGMKFADSYENWRDGADDGYDLVISGKTVNVKRNNRNFSSIDDFIGNFKNFERPILVSAKHVNTPDVTLILSHDLRGGIKIPKTSKKYWGIRKNVFDPRYKTTQDCFDVAKKHVSWLNLQIKK